MLPYSVIRHEFTYNFVGLGLVGMLAMPHGTAQSRSVQVGYCTPLSNIEAAKAAGFDYVELEHVGDRRTLRR